MHGTNSNNSFATKRLRSFALLSGLLAFVVFIPTVKNGFLLWDDTVYLTENPYIRLLVSDPGTFIKWAFSASGITGNWHPVTNLSHGIEYALFGLNPAGHHFVSVALHSINSALVCLLVYRLIASASISERVPGDPRRASVAALVAGLLFALHPVHVESIAWVSEQKDLLCALFYLLTLITYIKYVSRESGGRGLYIVTLFLFILALMSKAMAVSLPVVLIIIDIYPLRRLRTTSTGRLILEKLPFFLLAISAAVITLLAQRAAGAVTSGEAISIGQKVAVAIGAIGFYIYKLILPLELAPIYPYPDKVDFFTLPYTGSLLLILVITAFVIFKIRRQPALLALWLFFLVTLAPVLGFVQVGVQFAADRYLYIPSMAAFTAVALVPYSLMKKRSSRPLFLISIIVVALLAALYSQKSISQTGLWKDPVTLWSHEISIYPSESAVPYNNRAQTYLRTGQDALALADYEAAIKIEPLNITALSNRGVLYEGLGRRSEAIEDFEKIIRLDPGHADSYNNLGGILLNAGRPTEAIGFLKKAAELSPSTMDPYLNLGHAYSALGDAATAASYYKMAKDRENRR